MVRLFGSAGLRVDTDVVSTVEADYWEELSHVHDAFVPESDLSIKKIRKPRFLRKGTANSVEQLKQEPEISGVGIFKTSKVHPVNGTVVNNNNGFVADVENTELIEYRSIAVQTDGNYDEEPELPYKCCFCCRSSTPWVVWMFIIISIVYFKMGAIVTGRWIYLSSASFDEVVFYIAFTICLGFATIYFRRGTKYHNPFDLLLLVLTVPMMWALLTFTTVFLKKDIFFYVGSVIYSAFIVPYTLMGCYITYRFWRHGKLFLRRAEGSQYLKPFCRNLFFMHALMTFDMQMTICASIISMAPTVNYAHKLVWVSSLILGPISICFSILSWVIGFYGIRKEKRKLTWIFTFLSGNQFVLLTTMFLKKPPASDAYNVFINAALVFSAVLLLILHIGMLAFLWAWIVPNYGRGLKGPVSRTSKNNCIQCATLTVCR